MELIYINLLRVESRWFPFGPNWKQPSYLYACPFVDRRLWPVAWKVELTILYESKPPFRSLTPFIIPTQTYNYKNLTILHLAASCQLIEEEKHSISVPAEFRHLFVQASPASKQHWTWSFIRAMVLTLEQHQRPPEGSLKHRWLGPAPQSTESVVRGKAGELAFLSSSQVILMPPLRPISLELKENQIAYSWFILLSEENQEADWDS